MDSERLTYSTGMSLREIITILFLRKWSALAVAVGVIGAAGFLTMYLISPNYEAGASLIINTSDLIVPMVDAPPMSDFEKMTTFHTQKDVIASVPIVAAAVEQLRLDETRAIGNFERIKLWLKDLRRQAGEWLNIERWQKPHDPRAAAIDAVMRGLSVQSSPESKVIKVTLRTKSPQEAADTLNQIVDNYIEYYNGLIMERAAGLTDYLSAQIEVVRGELQQAEERMLEFRQRDRVALGSAGQNADGETLSLTGIADSQEVQNELKLYILAMEDELRKLSSELAQSHPQIVDLRRKLAAYVAAVDKLPERELDLMRLKREMDTLQESYLFLRRNLDKAQIVTAGNTASINLITVMERADIDDEPVSPKPRVTMILASGFGVILGLIWAIGMNFLDHTLRSSRDIEVHLGLRPLGSLRKL